MAKAMRKYFCENFDGTETVKKPSEYFPIYGIVQLLLSIGTYACSARNNSWPLAIFQPILAFGRSKSDQISCTFSMGQQSVTYKISHFQKTAGLFLILISGTAHDHQTLFEHNLTLCGYEMNICLAHAKQTNFCLDMFVAEM